MTSERKMHEDEEEGGGVDSYESWRALENPRSNSSSSAIFTFIAINKSIDILEDDGETVSHPKLTCPMVIRGNILRPAKEDEHAFLFGKSDRLPIIMNILNLESFMLVQHSVTTHFEPPLPGDVLYMVLPAEQTSVILRYVPPLLEGEHILVEYEAMFFRMVWMADQQCDPAYQAWSKCNRDCGLITARYQQAIEYEAKEAKETKEAKEEKEAKKFRLLQEMRSHCNQWRRSLVSIAEHIYGEGRFHRLYVPGKEPYRNTGVDLRVTNDSTKRVRIHLEPEARVLRYIREEEKFLFEYFPLAGEKRRRPTSPPGSPLPLVLRLQPRDGSALVIA